MSHRRRWITPLLLAACAFAPLAAIGVYAWNPFDARSPDPRQRILGIGLYRVPSLSMSPTLEPGAVIVARVGRDAVASVRRGDIVTFIPPHQADQVWLKRLVAFEGETVEIRAGALRIDGRIVDEPYVLPALRQMPYSREFAAYRVPSGHVFLLGDNRDNSEDSRFWGAAPRGNLRGRLNR